MVEIHLEEFGQHSWVRAVINTLAGSYGSAQFRFVARRAGTPDVAQNHVAVGATFPVMRAADLNDQLEPNASLDVARQRLDELDQALARLGWRRRPGVGRHWWSLTYEKTWLTDPAPGGIRRG